MLEKKNAKNSIWASRKFNLLYLAAKLDWCNPPPPDSRSRDVTVAYVWDQNFVISEPISTILSVLESRDYFPTHPKWSKSVEKPESGCRSRPGLLNIGGATRPNLLQGRVPAKKRKHVIGKITCYFQCLFFGFQANFPQKSSKSPTDLAKTYWIFC